jgi:hypothetical protein
LHDLTINTEVLSVETAVEAIVTTVRGPELHSTEASKQAVRNRALASRIRCALAADRATRRCHIAVEADNGVVTLQGAQFLGHAIKVSQLVPGVVDVKAHLIREIAVPLFPLSSG